VKVYSGKSKLENIESAIDEATHGWPDIQHLDDGIIFCFYARQESGENLAEVLSKRFPSLLIAGSSTAGEWLNEDHYENHIVLMFIYSTQIKWSIEAIENLDCISDEGVKASLCTLLDVPVLECGGLKQQQQVCITMMDGLSLQEEALSAMVAKHLIDIPMLGGSAGDGVRFEQTSLLIQSSNAPCRCIRNSALLLMVNTSLTIQCIKHQHLTTTDKELVITSATPAKRIVHSFNGIKASTYYAKVVGCDELELSPDVFAEFPLVFKYHGEDFVRSIQKVELDGSLTFYCAIDEGVILNLAERLSIENQFKDMLTGLEGDLQLALVFNCILRSLESEKLQCHSQIFKLLHDKVGHVIGFDTYGEQWNGLHINQTFTSLIFHRGSDE